MPLESVSLEELHDALEAVEAKKPTTRLLLAILYKQGPSVPMIADWFDMRAETIYRWFRRMDTEPLPEAVQDSDRPGRPTRLSEFQREQFEAVVSAPPAESGYEADHWTPDLAQAYLREEFQIEYSLRHVRRLLDTTDAVPSDVETEE